MASAIANLAVSLTARTDKFRRGMKDSRDDLLSFDRAVKGVKNTLAGLAASYLTFDTLKDSLKEFGDEEATLRRISGGLKLIGKDTPGATADISKFADSLSSVTAVSDDTVLALADMGVRLGKLSGTQLKTATQAAVGLSKVMGIDAETSMRMLIRAINGNTNAFARQGLAIDKTKSKQEQLNYIVQTGLNGMSLARDEVNTYNGAMAQLGNSINNVKEEIGARLAPTIIDIANTINQFGIPAIKNMGLTYKIIVAQATLDLFKLRDAGLAIFNKLVPKALSGNGNSAATSGGSGKGFAIPGMGGLGYALSSAMGSAAFGMTGKEARKAQEQGKYTVKEFDPTGGHGFGGYSDPNGGFWYDFNKNTSTVRTGFGKWAGWLYQGATVTGLATAAGTMAAGIAEAGPAAWGLGARVAGGGGTLLGAGDVLSGATGGAVGAAAGRAAPVVARAAGKAAAAAGESVAAKEVVKQAAKGGWLKSLFKWAGIGVAGAGAAQVGYDVIGKTEKAIGAKKSPEQIAAQQALDALLKELNDSAGASPLDPSGRLSLSDMVGSAAASRVSPSPLVSNYLTRVPGSGDYGRQLLDINRQQLEVMKQSKTGIDQLNANLDIDVADLE